jgi:hypothetical protein
MMKNKAQICAVPECGHAYIGKGSFVKDLSDSIWGAMQSQVIYVLLRYCRVCCYVEICKEWKDLSKCKY